MPATDSQSLDSPQLHRVGECLYRNVSSGIYQAIIKVGGKQYKKSLKTKDRKVAERFLSDFRNNASRLSRTTSASRVLFRELAGRWLDAQRSHLKPSSFRRRETSVGQLNKHIGGLTLRLITPNACDQWAARRAEGLSASTFNNERDTLRTILDYAKREGLLLDNPADHLARKKSSKTVIKCPTKEDFRKLVETLLKDPRSHEAANLVQLLAYSGMRLAEATSMRWEDVNFGAGKFIVTGGEVGTKNHEMREIPLSPALRAFLERLSAERKPAPADLVIRIASAKKALAHACREAGIPNFTHHSIRHFFVTNAIEVGINDKTIAKWVGHKDGGVLVAKTYGHLRDSHSYEMAKRMTFSIT